MRIITREPSRSVTQLIPHGHPRISTVWQRNASPERAPRPSQVIGGLTPLRGKVQHVMPSPGICAGARAQTPRPGPPGRALTTPRTVKQSDSTVKLHQEAPSPIPAAWINEFQIYAEAPSLGGGAFAEVYRVEHKKSRQQFAIKVMHWPNFQLRGIEAQIDAELRAMTLAAESSKGGEENHIVRMLKHAEEGEYVFVLLELCGGGDILRKLSTQKSGKFPEADVAAWALHLFLGLKNIHALGVIHRDIKPDNLLCTDNSTLKIADFGWCAEKSDKPSALAGTFQYMAPEVLQNQMQTEAVDVWSAGATLFQLLTGRAMLQTYLGPNATNLTNTNPHEATRIKQSWLVREINDICPPLLDKKPEDVSNQCWDFLRRILVPDQRLRATVEEALRHPWLASQVTTNSRVSSLEPSPEPAISMSPERRSPTPPRQLSPESVQDVPTPLKERSYVPGRNMAYSPPVDKSKGSPLSKCSLSGSPRRELVSPLPALAGRRRTPRESEGQYHVSLEASSRSVPPITRRNSGHDTITQEITPFELECRLGRASSLSNVQSLSTRELRGVLEECSEELSQRLRSRQAYSVLSGSNGLQRVPDPISRSVYGYDSLLATAPSVPCDRTRSPGPSKSRKSEVFTHSVRKGDTSPIRVHEIRRSEFGHGGGAGGGAWTSTLKTDTPARRVAMPAPTISTRTFTAGYPVDTLSKSMNPRNATAAATRECRTPMVPLHPLGLRDFGVPTQSVLVHQSNQTLGHQTVTYRQDVHWQPSTMQQPAQRLQRSRRETLGGAWPPPQVARY